MTAEQLKMQFRNKFTNISRIMDCVGCTKCRLWGKVCAQSRASCVAAYTSYALFCHRFRFRDWGRQSKSSSPTPRAAMALFVHRNATVCVLASPYTGPTPNQASPVCGILFIQSFFANLRSDARIRRHPFEAQRGRVAVPNPRALLVVHTQPRQAAHHVHPRPKGPREDCG